MPWALKENGSTQHAIKNIGQKVENLNMSLINKIPTVRQMRTIKCPTFLIANR
jgi:hypothetical protein